MNNSESNDLHLNIVKFRKIDLNFTKIKVRMRDKKTKKQTKRFHSKL